MNLINVAAQSLVQAYKTARIGRPIRIVIFLSIILPVILIACFSYFKSSQELTESILSRRQSIAHLSVRVLKEKLDNLTQIGVSLAGRVQFRRFIEAGEWNEAVKILESIPKDFPFIERLFLTDPAGTEMADMPPLAGAVGKNFAHRDWYQGVSREWKPYVSEIYQRAAEPRYNVIAAAIPIKSESKTLIGILVLQVRADTLLQWVKEIDAGYSGFAYVVDKKGHLAAHPKFPPQGEIVDFSSVPSVQRVLSGKSAVEVLYNPIEKEMRLVAYEPVPEYGWGVIVQQPAKAAFALRNHNLERSLIIYGLIFLLNCFLAFLILFILQTVDKLRQREKTFLESIGDGVFAIDRSLKITLWNRMAREITGWKTEEALGKPFKDFIKFIREADRTECVSFIEETIATGKVKNLENSVVLITKEGREVPVGDSAAPVFDPTGKVTGAIVVFRDVSHQKQIQEALRKAHDELEIQVQERTNELKQTQQQLLQSQKMEAIGRLAGGIAHDFNNQLLVITGYADLLLNGVKENDSKYGEIQEIKKAAERSASLTRQLLAFSRRSVLSPKVFNLNVLILDLENMCRRLIGADVELVMVPGKELGLVKVDPAQIEQALMNLVVNARDAMPKGGKLTIETANVILDKNYALAHREVLPGEYVMLAVTDTGTGMTEEVKRRIFEPFFTTKEKGKGTGLGLATVYGIVKQGGGNINLYSELGRGTAFKIYFPRSRERADTLIAQKKTDVLPTGTETVLVAEDEEAVRKLVAMVLRKQGYHVLEASNGNEALRLASGDQNPKPHLLVTDVIMPEMGGKELVEKIREVRPDIKVLFTSGYTDDTIVRHGVLEKNIHFLGKPYTEMALACKVREVLDHKGA